MANPCSTSGIVEPDQIDNALQFGIKRFARNSHRRTYLVDSSNRRRLSRDYRNGLFCRELSCCLCRQHRLAGQRLLQIYEPSPLSVDVIVPLEVAIPVGEIACRRHVVTHPPNLTGIGMYHPCSAHGCNRPTGTSERMPPF